MADRRILLIGLGGFGRNHLRAWYEIGRGTDLFVAELDPQRHKECRVVGLPDSRITTDYRAFLDQVDVVDVVTPSTTHFDICRTALLAGKDVFVEKPMTMTSTEADELADIVGTTRRTLQVGYYYRYHPLSLALRDRIRAGVLGDLRYLSGSFMGFKRARTDVGVTHTDGIHFLDLFNWLIGRPPEQVYADIRDHFGRGMEDWSVVLARYPGHVVAKVECGYIQPGRWHDKVVPNAMTTKEIFVCGSQATAEVDFETDNAVLHPVRHEFNQQTWVPVSSGSMALNGGTATPLQMICDELRAFLHAIDQRERPATGVIGSGVVLAKLMEAVYESASRGTPVALNWLPDELESLRA
jgi:predicted dehydrogenase